ncbi:MAG: ABC transporter ATP-binding protein [Dethiosulfovibrio peptidovorans]|nr:MAG: ABC transporter ATP-binding protein [Dethiosulfovibrio peptidovorans]
MIDMGNLRLTLGGRKLYDGLSWRIPDGSKVGLVGANGSGKTTLLRVLLGMVEVDEGTASLPSSARVGYLPQDLHELPDISVLAYIRQEAGIDDLESTLRRAEADLSEAQSDSRDQNQAMERYERAMAAYEMAGGHSFDAMAQKAMKGLGFKSEDSDRPISHFSGGWKMRIALAGALLSRPDVLLLDEPTNHLDTESMEWLEGWLGGFSGTVVAISHDRRFMDKIMTSIAELADGSITVYRGNFSRYLEESAALEERRERARSRQQAEIERTRDFIDRFRSKASKASLVQSRVKKLERMEAVALRGPNKSVSIAFPSCPRSGHTVVSAVGLSKSYGNLSVFQDLDLQITRGEKIALVGVNGAGKSTLSRLIAAQETPDRGIVELGYHVSMGFFSQESSLNLDYGNTVWQEVDRTLDRLSPEGKRSLLGAFLFPGDDIHKPISILSGGEKSRVALVKLLLQETNFLILDEPTNHLDMTTKELFQRALLKYDGTMLIVSHDRFFLDNLVSRVLEIRKGHLHDYQGNYSAFVARREQILANEQANQPSSGVTKKGSSKRTAAERRNRLYREKKPFLDELERVETDISQLEEDKGLLHQKLCDPQTLGRSSLVQELMTDLASVEDRLARIMVRWEELMETIQTIETRD